MAVMLRVPGLICVDRAERRHVTLYVRIVCMYACVYACMNIWMYECVYDCMWIFRQVYVFRLHVGFIHFMPAPIYIERNWYRNHSLACANLFHLQLRGAYDFLKSRSFLTFCSMLLSVGNRIAIIHRSLGPRLLMGTGMGYLPRAGRSPGIHNPDSNYAACHQFTAPLHRAASCPAWTNYRRLQVAASQWRAILSRAEPAFAFSLKQHSRLLRSLECLQQFSKMYANCKSQKQRPELSFSTSINWAFRSQTMSEEVEK